MKITVEKPETIVILYRQEKSDEDYGSCLWARFYFDTKNYVLHIESDCGNYTYGWVPTPDHETFLQLCCRFDSEYLLYKLSDRTVIDSDATWKAVKELVEETLQYSLFDSKLDENDWQELESACYHCRDQRDVIDCIFDAIKYTELSRKIETEDLCGAIEMDYPANAKKIVSVFINCIQPFIKTMED